MFLHNNKSYDFKVLIDPATKTRQILFLELGGKGVRDTWNIFDYSFTNSNLKNYYGPTGLYRVIYPTKQLGNEIDKFDRADPSNQLAIIDRVSCSEADIIFTSSYITNISLALVEFKFSNDPSNPIRLCALVKHKLYKKNQATLQKLFIDTRIGNDPDLEIFIDGWNKVFSREFKP